jgi:hypothetical protein
MRVGCGDPDIARYSGGAGQIIGVHGLVPRIPAVPPPLLAPEDRAPASIIRQWQALNGGTAHHAATGRSFDELAREAGPLMPRKKTRL